MNPIKLGVIGLHRGHSMAHLAHNVCGHLFEVTAVSDLLPARMARTGDAIGLPEAARFADYRQLIAAPDVEAVLVETGAQVFAQICCAAMRAGKHVAADVPMAFTRQDVWDLVVTTEQTGMTYCMAEQVRFANFVVKWQEHIERGDIGEPLFIQGEYVHPDVRFYFDRVDGGEHAFTSVDDVAKAPAYEKTWRNSFVDPIKYIPHELSPLLKIIADRVTSVSCYTSDTRMYGDHVGMLDMQCALMHTARGRTIRIMNSFTAPRGAEWGHHWYHIMGTDGVLETSRPYWADGCEAAPTHELLLSRDGRVERTRYAWVRPDPPFGDESLGHAGLEAFFFQEFHDSIRGLSDNELDVYTMAEAVLPGIIAAESAAQGGVRLEVPDVRPGPERAVGEYPG